MTEFKCASVSTRPVRGSPSTVWVTVWPSISTSTEAVDSKDHSVMSTVFITEKLLYSTCQAMLVPDSMAS